MLRDRRATKAARDHKGRKARKARKASRGPQDPPAPPVKQALLGPQQASMLSSRMRVIPAAAVIWHVRPVKSWLP